MPRKKTIALLTTDLTSKLSRDIWAGIQDVCHKSDTNCLCFVGNLLASDESTEEEISANIIYSFISKRYIDGIIVYGGDLAQYISTVEFIDFCKQYAPLPIVNIAMAIPEIPSVIIDNYSGMYQLTEHMIQCHGFKRLAFIKGPPNHKEAEDRFRAYCDALQHNNIQLDKDILFLGEFTEESGCNAVKKLCNKKDCTVDAIIAVDDDTALGAYRELEKKGIKIPDSIALAGFDDSDIANVLPSPLTTVNQPLFIQGKKAGELLLMKLQGKKIPQTNEIETILVVRQSCGCIDELIETSEVPINDLVPSREKPGLSAHIGEIQTALIDINIKSHFLIPDSTLRTFVDSFINSVATNSSLDFLRTLETIMECIETNCGFVFKTHELISCLRRWALTHIAEKDYTATENLFHKARIFISQKTGRINSHKYFESIEYLINLGTINNSLNSSFAITDIGTVFEEIAYEDFSEVGIHSFFLSLYSDPQKPDRESQLVFMYHDESAHDLTSEKFLFPTKELLPEKYSHFLAEKNLIVNPICFEDEQYGFTLIETDTVNLQMCDILSWQISSTLKRLNLIEEMEQHTNKLQYSIEVIKKTQKKLVEAEKMASLGNLVAGVAHEINTPIGASVTYASYLNDITTNFQGLFKSDKLTKKEFTKYMDDATQVSQGILLNMKRAAELIQSFKNVAVDRTNQIARTFNVKEYIEEILISLRSKLKKTEHTITVTCAEDIEIESYPGIFSQIISNFIINSLSHGFEFITKGEITISVTSKNEHLYLDYRDNGRGIKENMRQQIFEPFFTTKRGQGGSGLGMHIVYNLITQSLKGNIVCESQEGEGICFHVSFPILPLPKTKHNLSY